MRATYTLRGTDDILLTPSFMTAGFELSELLAACSATRTRKSAVLMHYQSRDTVTEHTLIFEVMSDMNEIVT